MFWTIVGAILFCVLAGGVVVFIADRMDRWPADKPRHPSWDEWVSKKERIEPHF